MSEVKQNILTVEPLRLKESGYKKCSECGCKIKGDPRVLEKLLDAGLCWHCYFKRKRMFRGIIKEKNV